MHIAIFVDFHDSSMGGVQTSVRGQREGLERLGHKVTIVSPPPTISMPDDPVTICVPAVPFVRPNGFPMVAPTRRNRRFIEARLNKRGSVDIIHTQTNLGMSVLGVQIAKDWAIPLVQTMHGRDDVFAETTYPLPTLSTLLLRGLHSCFIRHKVHVPRLADSVAAHNAWQVMINLAQVADYVVVPSSHFLVKFREHGLTTPIEVISNGISDQVVAGLSHRTMSVSSTAPLRVMWCGRFSLEKRPIDSIKAVSHISGCQLDLYGSGPLAREVQDYIDAHGVADRVHVMGSVQQGAVLSAMQDHDVLLYPSYGFDNQPMVILEGVAAGIPIIYCDPDLTECMPRGGGLLTEGTSIESLEAALAHLRDNPEQRTNMHQEMLDYRPKIVQSYHSKKMVRLYERVCKNNANSQ